MRRAFDRPHRGHVSRSDELFSAALRRGCRGRNRALLPFCTVIDTSTFRGRVARKGRSCFRCVPVYAPKTGRRYDQRRLAQFRCERALYTRPGPGPPHNCAAGCARPSRGGLLPLSCCPVSNGGARVDERATWALGATRFLADELGPVVPGYGRHFWTRLPRLRAGTVAVLIDPDRVRAIELT